MRTLLIRVVVSLVLLTTARAGASGTEEATAATAPPPRTVLLLGDSLIVSSFGEYLEKFLVEQPVVNVVRRAKSSTGLARPDFFNWMTTGREQVEQHRPDVVVVIMGGNDGQGLTDEHGKAQVQWGAAGWEAAYRQRVEDFLQVLEAPGRKLLWVELPVTGTRHFERKLGIIRRVLREAVSAHGEATHLETRPFFTDARGAVLRVAPVDTFRKPMKLRMEDGVHFTLAGGRYFASKVHPAVVSLLSPPAPAAPPRITCRPADAPPEAAPTPLALCEP